MDAYLLKELRDDLRDTIDDLRWSQCDVGIDYQLSKILQGLESDPKEVTVNAIVRVLFDFRKLIDAEVFSLDEVSDFDTLIMSLRQLGSLMERYVDDPVTNFPAMVMNLISALYNVRDSDFHLAENDNLDLRSELIKIIFVLEKCTVDLPWVNIENRLYKIRRSLELSKSVVIVSQLNSLASVLADFLRLLQEEIIPQAEIYDADLLIRALRKLIYWVRMLSGFDESYVKIHKLLFVSTSLISICESDSATLLNS